MAFQVVLNTAQVCVRGELNGERVQNDFYYRKDTGFTATDLEDLVTDFGTEITTVQLGKFPTSLVFSEVYAKGLNSPTAVEATDGTINGTAGTKIGEPLPNSSTLAIKRSSGLTGRSTHGRIYWLGLADSDLEAPNVVAATRASAMVAFCVTLDAHAEALGWTPVIVSRYEAGVLRPEGVTYDISAWLVTDRVIDNQRRRLPGRGT